MVDTETIILLIIIGIISSIFGKGRKGNRQNNIPKSFDEMRRRVNEQLENLQSPKKIAMVQPEIKETTERKTREFNSRAVETITASSVIPTAIETKVPTSPQPKEVEVEHINEVDANKLINGIIWSEILGEPRARKPYFQRKS